MFENKDLVYKLKPVSFLIRDGNKNFSWGDTDNEDVETEESQREIMSKYLTDLTSVFLKKFTQFVHDNTYQKTDGEHLTALLNDVLKAKSFLAEDSKTREGVIEG